MGGRLVIGLCLLWLAVGGCDRGAATAGGNVASGHAKVGGRVVSTVDGEPIDVGDVERVVRKTGLRPAEALDRLQRETLLAREARRRGYADRAPVVRAARKAAVQALLARAVEGEVGPDEVTDEEVQRVVDAHRDRFEGTDAEAREKVSERLLVSKRRQRLVQLVQELEERYGVERHPEHLDAVQVAAGGAGGGT